MTTLTQANIARPAPVSRDRRARAVFRRVPRAAYACGLIAFLNCAIWSVVIPPFQVPDETVHVAYTQYFAETGRLPVPERRGVFSQEQQTAMNAIGFGSIIGRKDNRAPSTKAAAQAVDRALDRPLSKKSEGGESVATNNPPLYYALESIPYRLTPGNILDRLAVMRLLSALMAGLTVLAIFMFLRELLPGSPWTWPVGALAVAFQPMFGFEAGGVNPDNLLYLTSAALFFGIARAFRRGLTARRGVAIGAAVGLGLVTKATTLAFVPGAVVALGLMLWRAGSVGRRAALRGALAAVGTAAVPVALYLLLNATVWDRPLWNSGTETLTSSGSGRPANFREQLVFTWQLFLPRLSFMNDFFFGYLPLWETWFRGINGRFGWLDYDFPARVYHAILLIVIPLLALATRALWLARAGMRRWLPELATYALMVAGLCGLIGLASYRARLQGGYPFEQPRYVLPLLPLYAALIALAVRGGGRRWGPTLGGVVVVLALAHTIFAQLLTIARYYS